MQAFFCKLVPPRPTFAADLSPAEAGVMKQHAMYWQDLIAREAVRMLIEQVRAGRAGGQPRIEHKQLEYTLIRRESSAAGPGKAAPRRKSPQPKS